MRLSLSSASTLTFERHLRSTTVIFNGPGFSRVARFCPHFYREPSITVNGTYIRKWRIIVRLWSPLLLPTRTSDVVRGPRTLIAPDFTENAETPRRRSTGNPLARARASATLCNPRPTTVVSLRRLIARGEVAGIWVPWTYSGTLGERRETL